MVQIRVIRKGHTGYGLDDPWFLMSYKDGSSIPASIKTIPGTCLGPTYLEAIGIGFKPAYTHVAKQASTVSTAE